MLVGPEGGGLPAGSCNDGQSTSPSGHRLDHWTLKLAANPPSRAVACDLSGDDKYLQVAGQAGIPTTMGFELCRLLVWTGPRAGGVDIGPNAMTRFYLAQAEILLLGIASPASTGEHGRNDRPCRHEAQNQRGADNAQTRRTERAHEPSPSVARPRGAGVRLAKYPWLHEIVNYR